MGRPPKIVPPKRHEKKRTLKPLPITKALPQPPRPKGPPYIDLPSAHPGKVWKCTLDEAARKVYPIWVATNTRGRFRAGSYARWKWRRGALFLYWYMYAKETRARARRDPAGYYYSAGQLKIQNYQDSRILTPRDDYKYITGIIIPPGNAMVDRVLTNTGGITKQGLNKLDDKEFVWPWLDEVPPKYKTWTELQVAKKWELEWAEHYYRRSEAPPPLSVGGHIENSFAEVYARYLKQIGRAQKGTKLYRWLNVWLERAAVEEKRLANL